MSKRQGKRDRKGGMRKQRNIYGAKKKDGFIVVPAKEVSTAEVDDAMASVLATVTKEVDDDVLKEEPSLVVKKKKSAKDEKLAASVDSNWMKLAKTMPKKRKVEPEHEVSIPKRRKIYKPTSFEQPEVDETRPTKVLAIDCEMVGVGPGGEESMLARVSIVNSFGNAVYDTFVAPTEKVVDYRTHVSGVTKQDLIGAPSFAEVQEVVANLLKGRTLVGHALHNDLKCLMISHPTAMIRDTAKYRPLMRRRRRPHSLKTLSSTQLNVRIQSGEHDSVTDARAAMLLYMKHRSAWEQSMKRKRLPKKKKTSAHTATTTSATIEQSE